MRLWNPLFDALTWEDQIHSLESIDSRLNVNVVRVKRELKTQIKLSVNTIRTITITNTDNNNIQTCKSYNVPIAICCKSYWNFLNNCNSQIVRLSKETLQKLDIKHGDIMTYNNWIKYGLIIS